MVAMTTLIIDNAKRDFFIVFLSPVLSVQCAGTNFLSKARHVGSHFVDGGTRRQVERLHVGVTEGHVGDGFGCADGAEVLAVGSDHPHAARPAGPDVASSV